jgi:hypothetical protein
MSVGLVCGACCGFERGAEATVHAVKSWRPRTWQFFTVTQFEDS